ncbi:hypothetical protein TNIN_160631 [Trichonephila inaurata madagascariensis]|uniref:Uncharacterized protein n=1 Tax=Trichonephila inaurata madagascariensis TaxID=2747483 RepID=A0A8X7C3K4_9ARAC|nr:hypothetical protein TNIN_160631 [Trichonephila inaurata madagascariensis]
MRFLVYKTPLDSAEYFVDGIVVAADKISDTRNFRESASVVPSPVSPVEHDTCGQHFEPWLMNPTEMQIQFPEN